MIWPKNDIFIEITKKGSFARNADSLRDMNKKRFLHSHHKALFCVRIVDSIELWPKNDFFTKEGHSVRIFFPIVTR